MRERSASKNKARTREWFASTPPIRMVIQQTHNQSEYPTAQMVNRIGAVHTVPKASNAAETHWPDLFPNLSESPQTLQTANIWPGVFQALLQRFSFSVHWGSRRSWARNLSTFSKRQHWCVRIIPALSSANTLALLHVFSTFRRLYCTRSTTSWFVSFHCFISPKANDIRPLCMRAVTSHRHMSRNASVRDALQSLCRWERVIR